jgi:hypothetical protein
MLAEPCVFLADFVIASHMLFRFFGWSILLFLWNKNNQASSGRASSAFD